MSDPAQVAGRGASRRSASSGSPTSSSIAGLATGRCRRAAPRRSDLAIERHCLDLLAQTEPPLAGAGVVVAPYVLSDEPYWLEWWLAGPDESAGRRDQRLAVDVNPDSVTFRDYTSLAWFAGPQRTGRAMHHRSVRRLPLHRPVHPHLHRSPHRPGTGSSASPGSTCWPAGSSSTSSTARRRARRPRRGAASWSTGPAGWSPVPSGSLGDRRPDPRARVRRPAARLAGHGLPRHAVRGGPASRVVRTG